MKPKLTLPGLKNGYYISDLFERELTQGGLIGKVRDHLELTGPH